jgi:hypothetical protein
LLSRFGSSSIRCVVEDLIYLPSATGVGMERTSGEIRFGVRWG